jgi:uncharacterized protein
MSASAHEIDQHTLRSKYVDQAFLVRVLRPPTEMETGRLRVLYCTDADEWFDAFAVMLRALQVYDAFPPMLLVGVGYGDYRQAQKLRFRDYLSVQSRDLMPDVLDRVLDGIRDGDEPTRQAIAETTSAAEFVAFLSQEAIPFVEATYPASTGERGYFGYSAGALLGLTLLAEQPDIFSKYVLGSPPTWFSGKLLNLERDVGVWKANRASHRVVVTVGEEEDRGRAESTTRYLDGHAHLADQLRSLEPSSVICSRTFPGETHASAWAPAFIHGLRILFSEASAT